MGPQWGKMNHGRVRVRARVTVRVRTRLGLRGRCVGFGLRGRPRV